MQKRWIMLALLLVLFVLTACAAEENQAADGQTWTELSRQDFEAAYGLGKAFVQDFYEHKAGRAKIDFTDYIVNANLLKYSSQRMAVETHVYDIKGAFIGIDQARYIGEDRCFYLSYVVYAQDSHNGGLSDGLEVVVSVDQGRLIVADWYIACGAGISSFDQTYRPNAKVGSPVVWDDQEFVQSLFERIGIE